jgi:predicted SprT family Zn-dependent metalloprotease
MDKQDFLDAVVSRVVVEDITHFRYASFNNYQSLSADGLRFYFGCTGNHRMQDCRRAEKTDSRSSSFLCKKYDGVTTLQISETEGDE